MIHWFKKHPEFLKRESDALSKNKVYREKLQIRDNVFLSHGNIIVRLDKIHKFPILIVYPEGTPYQLPLVYPLKHELEPDFLKELAASDLQGIQVLILPFIKFHYQLRHQNATGVLCIVEWDSLDDGAKYYGISTILDRVADWCKGVITGKFPPDSQEVEFISHFNNVDHTVTFLYQESFLDEGLIDGDAYGVLYSQVPKGKFLTYGKSIYFGCLILGRTKAGLYNTIAVNLPGIFYDEGIKNAFDLTTRPDTINRLVAAGTLVKILWFDIEKEPSPFLTFNELITIVGNGSFSNGLQRMLPLCLNDFKTKPESLLIGIRFPNRKSAKEFQVFKVIKTSTKTATLLGSTDKELFSHLVESYINVEAIECEKFTDESFHQRNAGRANRELLATTCLNIAGVGALGGEIADNLAKAGVGSLLLIDNQVMKAHNAVRHIAGLDQMGVPKIQAVGQILLNHNPFIGIKIQGANINNIDVNESLPKDSITISCIGDDNTEAHLNERAVIGNKVIYYSRALRGGKAARIFRVIPGKDACFNCLDMYREDGKKFIVIPADPQLPTLKTECNNPIRPASAADLKLISALTSRIVLDEIQHGYGDTNHWLWTTEDIGELQPFSVTKQAIAPHPACPLCNNDKKVKLNLSSEALNFMQGLISQNTHVETGGVLAGYYDSKSDDLIVTHVSGPGPKAICMPTHFKKDVQYCQKFLDDLFSKFGNQAIYLGEWHSHPSVDNRPSDTDIKSLTEISFQKEYLTEKPVMIIFNNRGIPSATIHPAGKIFYYTDVLNF